MSGQRPLDFLVIGAAKSGTTTLFEHLRSHPGLYLPPGKELPFFSDESCYRRGYAAYLDSHFSKASHGALWGTVTPQYMEDGARTAERIQEDLPDARLIAMLRNPVERTFSSYLMRVRRGGEHRSFDEVVVDQTGADYLAAARSMPRDAMTDQPYLVQSEYGRILEKYRQYIDDGRLYVLFTEDYSRNPQLELQLLLDFLGLDEAFRPGNLDRRYHVGNSGVRLKPLVKLLKALQLPRLIWRGLPSAARRELRRRYWMYQAEVPTKGREMSAEVRARLIQFFAPDVARLQHLVACRPPWPGLVSDGDPPAAEERG